MRFHLFSALLGPRVSGTVLNWAFLNLEFNNFKNASYYAGEAYEAKLHGDTDRRGEMQQKQTYFLQQAKKWDALWN